MKKAVKDLQPGDILPATSAASRRVVLFVANRRGNFELYSYELGAGGQEWRCAFKDDAATLDVEPRVTPEDLSQLITIARHWIAGTPPAIGAREAAQDLVNKLSPPNPPTYEELMEMVQAMTVPPQPGGPNGYEMLALLADRARRAGLIK